MRCIKCGTESSGAKKFCAACGNPLSRRCPKCSAENAPSSAFCEDCGAALADHPASTATSSPQAASTAPNIRVAPEQPDASTVLDGERKTVTALFADIKGSTELMEELDPEEARAIIDPALKLMIDAVHRYDGYVVQSTGDGIFALFGAPVAHEDHPQRAVHAALAARDDLRRRGDDLRLRGRAGVEVRIGINTGEVVMRSVQTGGHTEYSPIGHPINVASRMQSVAPSDGVVISEETQHLVEGYFELHGLGPTEVKGVAGPINVFEVIATGASRGHFDVAAQRGLTKFVGRERELEQMKRALELAMGARGQILAVMAEAGTGKSRLVYEFKRLIPKDCKLLEAYSVSHGKASAWLPVLELLRDYFAIGDDDDAAARREKVRDALAALDPVLNDVLPYLFGLLGIVEGVDPLAQMDPQVKRQRTLDAIRRIVQRESLNQPLVVIFEDLHWIDEQTQALLDLLAESIANARMLLLVNYRPEYRHEWTNKSYYSQLRLNPLGGVDGAEMLSSLLGESVELDPLKRLVIERTGGNPFFIEEIVQGLFDEGALVRNGVVKVTRPLSQLRLPTTVQGILAARIDRLPPEQKDLLQTLSVIGRESSLGLLTQVAAHPDAHLERMLADLRAGEFIYEQPATAGVEYVFKHALTQEVAYNSLLIERRKQLHERAGQALESIFAEQLDDHLTQLAHHYSHSDNLNKAVEYLGRAGQQAIQRSAYADAINNLDSAIDLLHRLPDSPARIQRELPLQQFLRVAAIPVKGWGAPEVEKASTRARELCERLGNPPELFSTLFGVWVVRFIRAELSTALEVAQQLLQGGESSQNPVLQLFAHHALGETLFHMGKFPLAREHHEIALSLDDTKRPSAPFGLDEKVVNLSYLSWIQWHLGYPDQALRSCNEAIKSAHALGHPHSMAFAYGYASAVHILRGEIAATQEVCEQQYAISLEHGLADFLAGAIGIRGWLMIMRGHAEGTAQVEECIASSYVTGLKMVRPFWLCILADAYRDVGRFDDGLNLLREALTLADENEDRYREAETYRLKGELLLKQNDSNVAEAENCFRRAIDIARKQSAKSWELRATMSLARLLDKQGRRDEARAMLAEIYGWFTEGFDTADLKDAKALLEELNG
jgi:class 3 adenylate cyclase/predicted ATPase